MSSSHNNLPDFEGNVPELSALPPAANPQRPPTSFLQQQQPRLPDAPSDILSPGSRSPGSPTNERGSFKRDLSPRTNPTSNFPPNSRQPQASSGQLRPNASRLPAHNQPYYTPNIGALNRSNTLANTNIPSPRLNASSSYATNTANMPDQPSFMFRSMQKDKSSFTRLGSSVSRAFGLGSASQSTFNRNSSSFQKSWSVNFVRGQIIPPITTSTLRKEDCEKPYPTHPFSLDYLPFWLLTASFFVMFTAYSLLLNLLTTVYGTDASLAVGILYMFFILSAIAMPSINMLVFKNNTMHTIFIASFGNTVMMICATIGYFPVLLCGAIVVGSTGGLLWVGYASVLSVLSRAISEADQIRDIKRRLRKRIKGQTEKVVEERVDKLVGQLLLPNGRVDLTKLTDEQTKRLMLSTAQVTPWLTLVGWCFNSLNSVLGGIISYFVLSGRDNSDPVAAARPLFIVFSILGCCANLLYFITFRMTPTATFAPNDQPLQVDKHDEDRINDNIDIVDSIDKNGVQVFRTNSQFDPNINHQYAQSPNYSSSPTATHGFPVNLGLFPVVETVEENDEDEPSSATPIAATNEIDIKIIGDSDDNSSVGNGSDGGGTIMMNQRQRISLQPDLEHIKVESSTSQQPIPASSLQLSSTQPKSNPFAMLIRSLYFMSRLTTQRPIYLALVTFFHMLFPITLYVSFFTASSIKPTLGTENIPIFMIVCYLSDAIAALTISRVMKGFIVARWCSIIGSFVQLIFVLGVIALPPSSWIDPLTPDDKTRAWATCFFLAILCGIGDALMQSGTNSALGIIVEGSPLVRSGGFGIAQACKSTGSVTIFISARLTSFQTQTYIVLTIITVSIVFQIVNVLFHIPIDVDKLMGEYNDFIQRQTAPEQIEDDPSRTTFTESVSGQHQQLPHPDSSLETTLEGLGSADSAPA